jgi:hypothetical protein
MSILNAITAGAGGVALSGDTSGNLTIQSAGNTVCTITATGVNAGIQVASWAIPAFSAYASNNQTVSNITWTKIVLNAEDFDTANAFDSSTNYRFQPTIAGYYQINTFITGPSSNTQNTISAIYRNGSLYRYTGSSQNLNASSVLNASESGSILLYLNGSTDYIELYVYQQTGGSQVLSNPSYFNGFLARSA